METLETAYKLYAKAQAAVLKAEAARDVLREEIIEKMQSAGVESADTTYGKFTVSRRTSWSYSDAIKKMSEKLKLAQYREQEKGIAEKKITTYLTFTSPKE